MPALGDGQTVLLKTQTPEIKDKLLIPLSHGPQGCEVEPSLGHKPAGQIFLHYRQLFDTYMLLNFVASSKARAVRSLVSHSHPVTSRSYTF